MKRLITTWIIALLVIPTTLLADNYTQLWKKVNEARDKDLPKTQIALLQSIIDNQSLDVDVISGATTESQALVGAITNALKQ